MTPVLGLTLALLLATSAGAAPRGIRNNNPGNIVVPDSGKIAAWPGAVGADDAGYMQFTSSIDGVRAIVINLRLYRERHGLCTVHDIISRWTRVNDTLEHRRAYINFVASRLGVTPETKLNLYNAKVLKQLTRAIVYYENGQDPYPDFLYGRIFPGA